MKSSFTKHLTLGLLCFACAAGSASVMADTIVHYDTTGEFYTYTGSFPTPTLGTDLGSTINSAPSVPYVSVAFGGLTDATVTVSTLHSTSNIQLGTFTVSLNPSTFTGGGTFDDAFLLTVDQTSPVGGIKQLTPAHLTGTISYDTSSLKLYFSGASDFVQFADGSGNLYSYSPSGDHLSLSPVESNNGVTTYQGVLEFIPTSGAPVTTPLPAAAWGGMGLMGLLGGVKALRRRSLSR